MIGLSVVLLMNKRIRVGNDEQSRKVCACSDGGYVILGRSGQHVVAQGALVEDLRLFQIELAFRWL